jgi:hypothetical protein
VLTRSPNVPHIAADFFTSSELRRRDLNRIFTRIGRKPRAAGDGPSTMIGGSGRRPSGKPMIFSALSRRPDFAMVDFPKPGRSKQA